MTKIIYVASDGMEHVLNLMPGMSLMEGALYNDVPGMDAVCGGACSCATCHIYIEDDWWERVGERSEQENAMLSASDHTRPNSRLACEIRVTEALDGLIVRLPESQG